MYDLYISGLAKLRGSGRPKSRLKQKFGGNLLQYGPGLITCRQFDGFVADYVDGNLTDRQLRVFEGHMVLCPMCRIHFRTYLATFEMSQQAFGSSSSFVPDSVPEDLTLAVLDAIGEAHPRH